MIATGPLTSLAIAVTPTVAPVVEPSATLFVAGVGIRRCNRVHIGDVDGEVGSHAAAYAVVGLDRDCVTCRIFKV